MTARAAPSAAPSTAPSAAHSSEIPAEIRGVTAEEAHEYATALPFARLEARLATLDGLARGLWLHGLTHSHGEVESRLPGIAALRDALAEGRLPSIASEGWPGPVFAEPLAERLAEPLVAMLAALQLPAFCDGKPELAEQVLRSLLWHLDRIVDYLDYGNDAANARDKALADFAQDWGERCGVVHELAEVFGDFGDLDKNTRWDLLRGTLKSGTWQEVLRIRALLERLPDLAAAIRRLGRARPAEVEVDTFARSVETTIPVAAPRAARRVTRVPDLPGETRGITRAGRIARMLPAESMLLAHPRLRLIWHARHAERTLLCYDDDDRLEETLQQHLPSTMPSPERRRERPPEAGAMLVCVDTSGSMRGAAESVAKAVVLEAARTAFAQRRACHVFAFGGADELIEFTATRDAEGIARLAEFLGQSFAGGTDICTALDHALQRLQQAEWRNADLLIASDGEFGATPDKAAALAAAKEALGLRVQGVLIGDRETIGFLELADDILWVRDWRRLGGEGGSSPVHSQRLTAMYFPNALRSPQGAQPVSGDTAAAAFRAPLRPGRP